MRTAKFVRQIENFSGDARLYQLSKDVEYSYWDGGKRIYKTASYVIVSATVVPFSGPETNIFPASEDGVVLNLFALDGSLQSSMDHAKALKGAGFEIEEE